MKVETFECVEITETGRLESTEEQIALIESLGLKGQKSLLTETPDGKTVQPYPKMTREQQFVYERICPKVTGINEYDSGPIPVRVLQIIAHAKELKLGDLYVLHPLDAHDPDPVLVACNKNGYPSWNDFYMLARWGETLTSFEELCKRAIKIAKSKAKVDLLKIKTNVERDLAGLECMDSVEPWLAVIHSAPVYYGF